MHNQPANFGIAAHSFPCGCGFLRTVRQPGIERPLDAWGLIELATAHGLYSVELPLVGMLPAMSAATIERLRAATQATGLELIVDTGVVTLDDLPALLPLAAQAGARIVRATVSSFLEGARGELSSWQAHLAATTRRLGELRPLLAEYDLTLALENHQDTTADDLLALCEAGGERVGVTFDVVNPLAVGEEPFAFARRLGPWIRNVHLKDYTVFPTASGYRLVRCALGEGVIDWSAMRALLHEVAPAAPQQIELAALYGRHIRLFEDDWWRGFPPRDARDLAPALRLLAGHAQPAATPWQTPWEREATAAEVAAYELNQFEASVRHLRALG